MMTRARMQCTADEATPTALRVFVVEDEGNVRELWMNAFQDAGCVVAGAHCGAEALLRLPEFAADVIVTDLSMPGIDGGEMITRLRQEPYGSDAAVVLVTALAHGLSPERAELLARRSGVDAVIPKPVRPLELVHRVLRTVREPKGRAGSAGCCH
jgi:two-component system, OmpR family, alkaline phosphatase synthesis response regulator PhoP